MGRSSVFLAVPALSWFLGRDGEGLCLDGLELAVVVCSCFLPVFYEASDHLDSRLHSILGRRNLFVPLFREEGIKIQLRSSTLKGGEGEMFLVIRSDDEGELLIGVITKEEELLPLITRDMVATHTEAIRRENANVNGYNPFSILDMDKDVVLKEVKRRVREQILDRQGYKMELIG